MFAYLIVLILKNRIYYIISSDEYSENMELNNFVIFDFLDINLIFIEEVFANKFMRNITNFSQQLKKGVKV